MWRPMGSAAVAAGDGEFSTWTIRSVRSMTKSCTNVPSLRTAWARMPASRGWRSAFVSAGAYLRHSRR